MKRLSLTVLSLLLPTALFANSASPIGYWKTIDDVSGQPKSIVKIWDNGGKLEGKVIKGFKVNGKNPNPLCTKCKGILHDQKILGMRIMWDFAKDDNEWDGGSILDPNSGKTYRCTLKLKDKGKKLRVHGYIGIPLLGRTQVWHRISAKEAFTKTANDAT